MIKNDHESLKTTKIALIGEAMVEMSEVDFSASKTRIGFAGDTLNTAIYLARALEGSPFSSEYLTVVGRDPLSDQMISFIESEGIDTVAIDRIKDRYPALYAIHLDQNGERSFQYWRDQSAARMLFQTERPTFDDLKAYGVIYLSAITLAILPPDVRSGLIETCSLLKQDGHQIIFDSNFRPALWHDFDIARRDIAAMWSATTIAMPSHDDECILFPKETPEQTLARIARLGPKEIVLKRGATGPLLLLDDQVISQSFPPADKVVDTTAAGDSFNAGYIAARLRGYSPTKAAEEGHMLASHVIGFAGAISPRN